MIKIESRRGLWIRFGVGLVVALIICGWQVSLILRFRSPVPDRSVSIGQTIVVGGVSYRLDTFDVAPSFPVALAGEEPVQAMAGAILVKIIFTEEVVDPARDLETIYCDLTVNDPGGRRWTTSDLSYKVMQSTAPTCSGSFDDKAALRVPFQVGALFMVPVDAADQLTFRLRLSTERELVVFVR